MASQCVRVWKYAVKAYNVSKVNDKCNKLSTPIFFYALWPGVKIVLSSPNCLLNVLRSTKSAAQTNHREQHKLLPILMLGRHGEKQKDQSFKERGRRSDRRKLHFCLDLRQILAWSFFFLPKSLFLVVQHYGLWYAFHKIWWYHNINDSFICLFVCLFKSTFPYSFCVGLVMSYCAYMNPHSYWCPF